MTNLVLQPCGKGIPLQHFETTVHHPVRIDDHLDFLTSTEVAALRAVAPTGWVELWGALPANGSRYDRMNVGDRVVFIAEGTCFYFGTVTAKLNNVALAERLWGLRGGETWLNMFAVGDTRFIDVGASQVKNLIGYNPDSPVRRYTVLHEEESVGALALLESAPPAAPPSWIPSGGAAPSTTPTEGATDQLDERSVRRAVATQLRLSEAQGSRSTDLLRALADNLGLPMPAGRRPGLHQLEGLLAALGEELNVEDVRGMSNAGYDVTGSFWVKTLRALRGAPFSFICLLADNHASDEYEDVPGGLYGFDSQVSTWKGIVEAGAGSRLVFYNTQNADSDPQHFTSVAVIDHIDELEAAEGMSARRWRAHLTDYHVLPNPVVRTSIEIRGRNLRHGIQAITPATYDLIIARSGLTDHVLNEVGNGTERTTQIQASSPSNQPGGAPPTRVPTAAPLPAIPPLAQDVDDYLVEQGLSIVPRDTNQVLDEDEREAAEGRGRSTQNRAADKLTEETAVDFVKLHLRGERWKLVDDMQKRGAGYDLKYERGAETLLVEVKGIRGRKLAFNVTAKEWRVARSRPEFVIYAVIRALDTDRKILTLRRDQLERMNYAATAFRFTID